MLSIFADTNKPTSNSLDASNTSKLTEIFTILIEVPESNQVNATWKLFRTLLTSSTNQFIKSTGISALECRFVLNNYKNQATFCTIFHF